MRKRSRWILPAPDLFDGQFVQVDIVAIAVSSL